MKTTVKYHSNVRSFISVHPSVKPELLLEALEEGAKRNNISLSSVDILDEEFIRCKKYGITIAHLKLPPPESNSYLMACVYTWFGLPVIGAAAQRRVDSMLAEADLYLRICK